MHRGGYREAPVPNLWLVSAGRHKCRCRKTWDVCVLFV